MTPLEDLGGGGGGKVFNSAVAKHSIVLKVAKPFVTAFITGLK